MHETLISIEGLDPVVLLGNENSNLRALQDKFPKLRIVARGTDFIVKGDRVDIGRFEGNANGALARRRYNSLSIDDIERLVKSDEQTS